MGELAGVRVVVTGATSGLGEAMTTALLEDGATVALASRPTARLEAAVAAHRDAGRDAHALPVDVRDARSVQHAADTAVATLGGVEVVVNNAGIGMRTVNPRFLERPQPFFDVSPAGFADLVATNLTGYFLVARAFARVFVAQGHGRFVNISINHETMRRQGFVPYGPSRAGSESLAAIMAEDLAPYGITSNILMPGGATMSGMIPDAIPDAVRAMLLPAEVMGPPVVFLCSPAAAGLTGERIVAREFAAWHSAFRGRSGPAAP
jgi:gluconate 5-dehydrogenase